ncbi:FHA domain-containing protein [Nocardioides sp.]|uniref:FHA domain-containing protein n=1 Tax=Nocardioides sp. TaxID=35761 RepID=UPI003514DF9D
MNPPPPPAGSGGAPGARERAAAAPGELVVQLEGRLLRLDPARVVHRVGRAAEAEVVLTSASASRRHAELRVTPQGWVLVDLGSQFGTFVDGRRIEQVLVDRPLEVTCGPVGPGAAFTLVPPAQPAAPAAPDPEPAAEETQVLSLSPLAVAAAGASARSGPDLLVVVDGREHRIHHPATVTLGRLADSDVVVSDPAASRQHGRLEAVPGAWVYANVSDEGTFAGGRRVDRLRFDARTELRLGHPVAGPVVTLVPVLSAQEEEQRLARGRLKRRLLWAGGVATALAVVGGLLAVALAVGGEQDRIDRFDAEPGPTRGLSREALDTAKAATVKISAETTLLSDPAQTTTYHGSGSIIRSDGLILTNAHVAAPESSGLGDAYGDEDLADPDYLLVSLTDGLTDTNAAPAYRARVVASDGRLDVAVIKIYARADGRRLDGDLDLPTVPIGSSSALRAGDDVTVLGFPAVAGSGESITVTTGVVSTVLNDPDLGPRSELDTDARIAPGNSGGMAIDDGGRLIGVPTSLFADKDTSVTSGRVRSIDAIKPLIARAEQKAPAA